MLNTGQNRWIEAKVLRVASLLRVEQNPSSDESYRLLGYEWVEVIWVEPWALAITDAEWGAWCDRKIAVQYVCMTEMGVTRIGADDFWTALEEYEEYVAAEGRAGRSPPLQIVASGAGSIVHVGSSTGSSFGTVGTADSATVAHAWSLDFGGLAAEIQTLREATQNQQPDRDDQMRIGALAEAEAAAEAGDANRVASVLRRIAVWASDSARDLGLTLLETYLKKQVGL